MTFDREFLRRQLSELTRVPVEQLVDDQPIESLRLDSFALIELVVELQETLDVRLVQGDLVGLTRVGELLDLVERRMGKAA